MDSETKRGRGKATRGVRGRPRGSRGRGRGKKVAVSSDEETYSAENSVFPETSKENECENEVVNSNNVIMVVETENIVPEEQPVLQQLVAEVPIEPPQTIHQPLPPTIDMEADISQLEAPTFTTLSRGPPEPMLRLKWNHKVNLIGEKVLNPMIHCCDQCEKPILIYGRLIPCKHIFCLKCARAEPIKICPRCNDKVLRVEQSGLGTVFLCTHGGSRYGNTGCRRTYLSQRDLQAHINHRHVSQLPAAVALQQAATIQTLPPPLDSKQDTHKFTGSTRKLSESSTGATLQPSSALLNQRNNPIRNNATGIGSIPPPGATNPAVAITAAHSHSALTAANLARINNANAQECHQGKERLHQTLKKTSITQSHLQPETVADASYYSSVLNSFGAEGNTERSVRKY